MNKFTYLIALFFVSLNIIAAPITPILNLKLLNDQDANGQSITNLVTGVSSNSAITKGDVINLIGNSKAPVLSVNGKTGTVVLTYSDVGAISSTELNNATNALWNDTKTYVSNSISQIPQGTSTGTVQDIVNNMAVTGTYYRATIADVVTGNQSNIIANAVDQTITNGFATTNYVNDAIANIPPSTNAGITISQATSLIVGIANTGTYYRATFADVVTGDQSNIIASAVDNTITNGLASTTYVNDKFGTAITNYQTGIISLGVGTDYVSRVTILDELVSKQDDGIYFGRDNITKKYNLTNIATTWITKDSVRDWSGIAISSDGKYQSSIVNQGYIYTSSDYGNTWTNRDSTRYWYDIAMSADGKYQVTVVFFGSNKYIYLSSDYGTTWTPKMTDVGRSWYGVAISSDGKYVTAIVNNGQIYISSDFGNSWVAKETNRNWDKVAMSSDGKYQLVSTRLNGYLYASTDYGNTWTNRLTDNIRSWRGVAISGDGKYQMAAGFNWNLYISSDYGVTFTNRATQLYWMDVAISSDGKYQIAADTYGKVYLSTDYGVNWTLKKDYTMSLTGIATSSDGKYVSVSATGSQLYTSKADQLIDGSIYLDGSLYIGGNNINSITNGFATTNYVNNSIAQLPVGISTNNVKDIINTVANTGTYYRATFANVVTGDQSNIISSAVNQTITNGLASTNYVNDKFSTAITNYQDNVTLGTNTTINSGIVQGTLYDTNGILYAKQSDLNQIITYYMWSSLAGPYTNTASRLAQIASPVNQPPVTNTFLNITNGWTARGVSINTNENPDYLAEGIMYWNLNIVRSGNEQPRYGKAICTVYEPDLVTIVARYDGNSATTKLVPTTLTEVSFQINVTNTVAIKAYHRIIHVQFVATDGWGGTESMSFYSQDGYLSRLILPGGSGTGIYATQYQLTQLSNSLSSSISVVDSTASIATNAFAITKDPSGFAGDTDNECTFTFNPTNRVLSMTSTNPFSVYWSGYRFIHTNRYDWPAMGTNAGMWYFKWDESAGTNAVVDQNVWTLDQIACATVYWTGGTATVSAIPQYFISEETHGFMPWSVHRRFHLVEGSKYVDGMNLLSYSAKVFTNAYGRWIDEDILHVNPQTNICNVMYRNGLTGVTITPTTTQYTMTNGLGGADLMYDNNGTLADVGTGSYVNYFCYAVPSTDGSYVWVVGRSNLTTTAQASGDGPYSLGSLFPYTEGVCIRKVTLRNTNPPQVSSVVDYITQSPTAVNAATINHASTTGRDNTDSHPASAISVVTTAFTNNVLDGPDTDVQTALNDLDLGIKNTRTTVNAISNQNWNSIYVLPTPNNTGTITSTSGKFIYSPIISNTFYKVDFSTFPTNKAIFFELDIFGNTGISFDSDTMSTNLITSLSTTRTNKTIWIGVVGMPLMGVSQN